MKTDELPKFCLCCNGNCDCEYGCSHNHEYENAQYDVQESCNNEHHDVIYDKKMENEA